MKLHNTNEAQALALTIDDLSNAESYESITTTTRLAADPLKSCTDAELTDILNNQDKIKEGTGVRNEFNKSGNEIYFGYSFYLMNAGSESVDYNMDMHLLAVTRDLDEVLRVMVVYDDDYTNYEVYAKSQPDGTPESKLVGEGYHGGNLVNLGETIPFLNGEDDVIINKHFKDFNSGAFTKFTVIMWLDGWDAQETDDMLGGGIKLSLDFYIADEK